MKESINLKGLGYVIAFSAGFIVFAFYLLDNIIFSIVLGIICFLIGYKIVINYLLKVKDYLNRLDELHTFTTSITMQLSSTPSAFESIQQCEPYFKSGVKQVFQQYGDDMQEFLEALSPLFRNKSFDVFAKLLLIYEKSGGDILHISNSILEEIAFKKSSAEELYRIKKRKIVELFTMWFFAFISLFYLRVGLESYYLEMVQGNLLIAVVLALLLFLLSGAKAFLGLKGVSFEGEL